MKKRSPAKQDDRRRRQVEINLASEEDGPKNPLIRRRSGCALPFFGGGLFVLVALAVVHAVLG